MNEDHDTSGTASGDEGEELDPRAAAELLEQTTTKAQRQFDIRPPVLMLIAAPTVLFAYGAVWWSVRGQHPYSGPAGWALAVLYTIVIVWAVVVGMFFRRATSGIGGRTRRQRQADGVAFATIWIAVYVFQGALLHAGASHAIVYGIYPAAAPIMILGGAAAAHEAAKENWPWLGFALAAVALAVGAALAGPVAVWAVMGIGLCVLVIARAGARVWPRRA